MRFSSVLFAFQRRAVRKPLRATHGSTPKGVLRWSSRFHQSGRWNFASAASSEILLDRYCRPGGNWYRVLLRCIDSQLLFHASGHRETLWGPSGSLWFAKFALTNSVDSIGASSNVYLASDRFGKVSWQSAIRHHVFDLLVDPLLGFASGRVCGVFWNLHGCFFHGWYPTKATHYRRAYDPGS